MCVCVRSQAVSCCGLGVGVISGGVRGVGVGREGRGGRVERGGGREKGGGRKGEGGGEDRGRGRK